ncbi:hypothetical protein GOP47_0017689 [Adiantum capillus-veneris]|uniref:Acyl-[acyl-carrier-protein] hydrolase n=1 Tax=Adiantum capillus-veneris TaxID=13818 RepID=A0A9D4UFV2_ADICA|nr:hypothetical protein GOP47_0017689 [Adiantum capillus-veneris]
MSSLARSFLHGSLSRRKGSEEWPALPSDALPSRLAEQCTPARRWYLHSVRSVASEIPKRSSLHTTRINHTSQDLSVEAKISKKRGAAQLQELDRRNVVDERAHLVLPGIPRKDDDNAQLVALLMDRKTWLRDVAVVAVLAAAILAAVAEKEAELQFQSLPPPRKDAVDMGAAGRVGKEVVHQVPIDSIRRGRLVENGFVYRQTFVVRSYEVGFDRAASIGTLANLFQETALNHVGMSDFVGDGMGTTHAMMRHRLIWVVTKMHIQVVNFPVWGDVVEIDSWVSASGKNGMRRDFLVRDYLSGHVRARATSHWAMMNQDTRKLSKMPDDVRGEISPHFLERSVMTDETCSRIQRLDDSAPYMKTGLVPRLHDMDMNQHVNHVKYISWVLESVPQSLLVAYELMGMTLEYRKECSHSDVVCSLTSPDSPLSPCLDDEEAKLQLPFTQKPAAYDVSMPPSIKNPRITSPGPIHYTHLLRLQADSTEILRGRTMWRLKKRYS